MTDTRKPIRTDADIRNAKPEDRPYRRPVGHGLYLEIRPSGAKLWRYRYRLPDDQGVRRENMFALGEYGKGGKARGQFTLAEAEEERGRLRQLVKEGRHPVDERRDNRDQQITIAANTFKAVADAWIESKRPVRSAHYMKQIDRVFKEDVYPAIGGTPITSITHSELSDMLDKRAASAPSIALLMQQWIGAVFRFAIRKGKATVDPTYILRGSVERPPVQHKKPLLESEFPAFFAALDKFQGHRTTKIALQLLLYTFVRPGELCGARWSEFDLDGAVWRIPAERMKRRIEHWVPLSSPALEILRELKGITGASEWLFPNARDPKRSMTTKALNKALERMGYGGRFSAHGFRATASTALNDAGIRHDVVEAQLAHKDKNATRASYNQAIYWGARVAMMTTWALMVAAWRAGKETQAQNVVQLRSHEVAAA